MLNIGNKEETIKLDNKEKWDDYYKSQKDVKKAYDKDGILIIRDYEKKGFLNTTKYRIVEIDYSFAGNYNLKEVKFESNEIIKIGKCVFSKTSLTKLELPKKT